MSLHLLRESGVDIGLSEVVHVDVVRLEDLAMLTLRGFSTWSC